MALVLPPAELQVMRLLLSSSADQPSPNIDPAAAEMLSAQLSANKVRCMLEGANGNNGNGRTYGRKCAVIYVSP